MFHSIHRNRSLVITARLRTAHSAYGFTSRLLDGLMRRAVLLIPLLMHGGPVAAQDSRSAFALIRFGEQVQAELPRNWTYLDKQLARDLNTASEAIAKNAGIPVNQGDNMVLVSVNALDGQRRTRATLRISLRVAQTITQAQMQALAQQPASEIQAVLRPQADALATALLKTPGVNALTVRWVKVDRNEYLTCILASYETVLSAGPKIVDTWVCPVGRGTIKLSTSYDKALQAVYEPIVVRVWHSLRVPPMK
jgi:hypothetical protein